MNQTLLRFHRLNALFLALFILMHMATHLSGLWGVEAYNQTQSFFRLIYRQPLIEVLLLSSFILQSIVGLVLLVRGWRRGTRHPWGRVQLISGVLVLAFVAQHLTAMALARWGDGLNTNFYWPASVMSGAPFTWYFTPYYFVGVTALFVHFGCGLRLQLLRQGQKARARLAFWLVSLVGALLATLIVVMLLQGFYDIQLPAEWVVYLQGYLPGYQPQ